MAVGFSNTNKPINPRGNDASPKGYNRAELYSGKALDFDGVNDKVTIDTDALEFGANDFSFSVVVKWDRSSYVDNKIIAVKENTAGTTSVWQVRTHSDDDLYFQSYNGGWQTIIYDGIGGKINDGNLHHLLFVRVGTGVTLYHNGQLVGGGSGSIIDTLADGEGQVTIGCRASNAEFWEGLIAQPKVYNVALTAAQVADLYNNPEKVVPTGVADSALKLWLPMQEGAGTTAYDGSGNGNHGTISGATWTHGIGAPVAQTAVIDWNKGTNKLQYSEELNNSYYSKASILSVDANATTAPNGLTTAENIKPDTSNNQHYIYNTSIALNGQHTISIFAKYNGYNIGLRPQGIGSGQAFANFDLQNGTILGSGGTYYNDSSITSFGDGWYRCSLTLTYATAYGFGIYVVNGTTATELPVFSGDGTSGVYAWGAQVNAGATLMPYVRTGATAQTSEVLLPQGLTSGRDITGVNLFENVRKQGALNLDGNSWAEVHDNASLDITSAITLEAWVYFDTLSSKGYISKWGANNTLRSYLLYQVDGNDAAFFLRLGTTNVSLQTGDALVEGWMHIAGTYDGANMKVYVNGSESSSVAATGSIATNTQTLEIGRFDSSSQLQNQIAQPRIYNRALTAAEVLQNYNSGKNTYK